MKKLIALTALFTTILLTSCSGTPVIAPPVEQKPDSPTEQQPQLPADGVPVKTGFVVLPSAASSKSADTENGVAQSDISLVAVLVDDNGVITDCAIDAIQARIEFGPDGKLVTDPATLFPTKNELGTAYGMYKASSIGREWNEQMEALAQYAVGKTVAELRGVALNEKGAPADGTDLAASCTISIGGTVDTIARAVENAAHLGAVRGDRLAMTAVTDMAKSQDAGDQSGLAQTYATIAAITFHGDVISSCLIDGVQVNVEFDTAGQITTDLSAPVLTKNQLGADYGMKKFSSIGREWDQQAAAFAQYVTGKTADEVSGIAVNEKGAAADGTDLASACTVSLGSFQQVIAKAGGLQ